MTTSKESLVERRKKALIPTSLMYHKEPLQLVRAEGQFVWDEKGTQYLDAIGGIVCISAGHNHPKIKRALVQMLEENVLQHTSLLYVTPYPIEAAERLLEEAPPGFSRVAFTNSGSEANEFAFMAARNATGETMIVSLKHAYHGGTSGTLAHCGHHTWRFKSQPVSNATTAPAPNCYRCPFGKKRETCNLECAKAVEETIQTTTHGKIAAFIAEPVMGVGGFITPDAEYFHEVTKIVHRYGGKYISDEVQTGVGRCGSEFFLTKELGIDADMITMAKGLGNGAAVGAAITKNEVVEPMTGKLYFNTFAGDPFQMRQVALTIDIIREEGLIKNAKERGQALKTGFLDLQKRYPVIGDVRGRGLMMGLELVKCRKEKTYGTEETALLMDLMRDRGVLVGKGGLFGNVVRIAPPMGITAADVSRLLSVMDESLKELERRIPFRGSPTE